MPEYLAPGVYVEEVSFRSKSIEGVSTTTTGFIGPTRYGPTDQTPDVLTSLEEFQRVYGDGQPLQFIKTELKNDQVVPMIDSVSGKAVTESVPNFMWHAVRAFFQEGGKRLYVVRAFAEAEEPTGADASDFIAHANKSFTDSGKLDLLFEARWPGRAGKKRVNLTFRAGQNALSFDRDNNPKLSGVLDWDVVWVGFEHPGSPPNTNPTFDGDFYLAHFDPATKTWGLFDRTQKASDSPHSLLESPSLGDQICPVSVVVTVTGTERNAAPQTWGPLGLDFRHKNAGTPDSLTAYFTDDPSQAEQTNELPIVIKAAVPGSNAGVTGLQLLDRLIAANPKTTLADLKSAGLAGTGEVEFMLENGNDGIRPGVSAYEGEVSETDSTRTGLAAFEDIDDISIVAAPGSTYEYEHHPDAADAIIGEVITHCQRMRYRIAVLDCGDGQSIRQVRRMRGKIDSTYAAFYYPWVRVMDPITQLPIHLPPSGFVSGIYARNDINRAVYKAPANEVVNLAIGFEQFLNKAQQDVLNPEAINCFRFFEGRGHRLWGARTATSDSEWKYVNLRRYFAYLEHSIDKGTQWAVFEPNGYKLWTDIRYSIESFLLNEFVNGALLGTKPEEAFFVKCDRSTMTQNDLDNGRMVALVGVAALRPAEFVIIRIGQWTSDRKV